MLIRRTLAVLATTAALVLVGAGAASAAGNPHFIKNATSASLSGSSLVVTFKEAGLPSGASETITVTAQLDATYSCVNNGGHVPSDPKKTTVSTEVSESGEFTAGKNGSVTGMLTVSAPAAADVLDCPGGQTSTLVSGMWSNVSISDEDSGAFLALAGTFNF